MHSNDKKIDALELALKKFYIKWFSGRIRDTHNITMILMTDRHLGVQCVTNHLPYAVNN